MPRRPPVSTTINAVLIRVAVVAATAIVFGCGGPCGDLSDRICGAAGAQSAVCVSLERVVAAPHAGDREACAAGVVYLDELKRGR